MVRRLLISLAALVVLSTGALAQSATVPGSRPHGANLHLNRLRVETEIDTSAIKCLTNACSLSGAWTINASDLITTGLNGPLIANGSSALTAGTFSGNTTVFATMSTVAPTPGHYLTIDSSGNIADGGSSCCASGSVGTGTTNQVAIYAANGTAVVGSSTISLSGVINTTASYQISATNVLRSNTNVGGHPNVFVGSGGNLTNTGQDNYGLTNGLTNLTGGGFNACFGDSTCVSAANLSFATAMGHAACQNAADTATFAICIGPGAGASLAGSDVIVIGQGAGPNVSGTLVIGIGTLACQGVVAGSDDICLGYNTLATTQVGALNNNVAIADGTLQHLTTGSNNIGISAFGAVATASFNVGLGGGNQFTGGNYNFIGGYATFFFGAGSQNTVIGALAGPGISGSAGMSNSTIVGYLAGQNINSSSSTTNIVALGASSCNDVTTATGSICIGTGVNAGSATQNSLLNIGNLIRGDMANNLLRTPGMLQVGGTAYATASPGELVIAKETDSGTAPGAGFLKFEVLAGTTPGTCKVIVRAGTSTAAITLVDNAGAAC